MVNEKKQTAIGAAPGADRHIVKIAAELLPIIDEITTSDLQGCIGAEVSKLGLSQEDSWQLESDVLDYIYSARVNSPGAADRAPGARRPPSSIRFVHVRNVVMHGAERVAIARSKTMAKRIANALNLHTPNKEGV